MCTLNFSDTFAIGKMLSFMESLSPAQRIAFEAMTSSSAPMVVDPPPSPPVAQIFYNQAKKGRATAAEVLVLATLLALYPLDLAQSELVERGNET